VSEDLKILAEDLIDFCDAQESAVVKLRAQIGKMLGSEGRKAWSWDPRKIAWSDAEGSKGKYERSEDVNSSDFKLMLKDLQEHKGTISRDGLFYWSFRNGSSVGRKKREAKA
jgi:hypothetical protein